MSHQSFHYTKGAVIVHGKSEFVLTRYIYTNLHLPIKIISREKGHSSIQISGLEAFLRKTPFKTRSAFAKEYGIEYDKKSGELKNFKLFIIMDTDDCEEKEKKAYISGAMFHGHALEEYIVPIYNINNLEDVMLKAEIIVKRVPASQRGTYYSKIFPINSEPITEDTVEQIRIFADKLKGVPETNMLLFIDYCLGMLHS